MPKQKDIESILIIGAGPIIIGQACEFDYSGTQATQALKEEGFRIVLVNSNPATIMTDPELADATYIEPITAKYIEAIIKKEKPDALLPTVGGQTGLNVAMELEQEGVLKKYNVKLIGAQIEAIKKAEDRERFKEAMDSVGIDTAKGGFLGINFHYLPVPARMSLLEALDKRNFKGDYSKLKNLRYIKPTIKHYLRSQFVSGFLDLEEDDYAPAIFMPVAQWKKAGESTVHRDSRRRF